jgi:hypothetical protein
MAVVTGLALAWAAWLRFGPGPTPEPPTVGGAPPSSVLRLLDPNTSEPLRLPLTGPARRVVWVSFWSAAAPGSRADLTGLQAAWSRLKARPRFVMAAAAIEADRPAAVREAAAAAGATLPVYLAPPETRRAFGAGPENLPLHLLIDETGRVGAVARGGDSPTLTRLADQAERWLDELEPLGRARFARSRDAGRVIGGDLLRRVDVGLVDAHATKLRPVISHRKLLGVTLLEFHHGAGHLVNGPHEPHAEGAHRGIVRLPHPARHLVHPPVSREDRPVVDLVGRDV